MAELVVRLMTNFDEKICGKIGDKINGKMIGK